MQTVKNRNKINISFKLLIIKDWEKKNLSLENPKHHEVQQEIRSSQSEAVTLSRDATSAAGMSQHTVNQSDVTTEKHNTSLFPEEKQRSFTARLSNS